MSRWRLDPRESVRSLAISGAMFLSAGILGFTVLGTDFNASRLPDFPWISGMPVRQSSLLLPLFAGLFGLPGLILSLDAKAGEVSLEHSGQAAPQGPGWKDLVSCTLGGIMVGWLPGMTPGSSAAVASSLTRAAPDSVTVEGASRFVWCYSAISALGSVFALGAFFVLGRTRSGSMEAVGHFIDYGGEASLLADYAEPMLALVTAALVAGLAGRQLLAMLDLKLANIQRVIRSRGAAVASMVFVSLLVALLTGTRGLLIMACATSLGLLAPIAGQRRVLLMGSLLVPIAVGFFS